MLAEYSIVKHVKLVHLHIDCFFFLRSKYIRRIINQYSEKKVYKTKLNEYDELNYFKIFKSDFFKTKNNNKNIKIFYL